MPRTFENHRNIYLYILTSLFLFIVSMSFPSHAQLVDGVTQYRIYLVKSGAQLHNMNIENWCLDVYTISEPWIIERYGDGYSIRASSGSMPYVRNGGKYNNLGGSPSKLYLIPSGSNYYIRNENGADLWADLRDYRLYYRSGYGDLWNIVPIGFNVAYNANGGSYTPGTQTNTLSVTLPSISRPGYDFNGWYNGDTFIGDAGAAYNPRAHITLTAHWTARDDTKYKVEHYLMDLDGNGYTLKDTDELEGTSDTSVTPDVYTYEGFTSPEKQTVNINADGSRVVRYEYTRNKYTASFDTNGGVADKTSDSLYYENPLGALPEATRVGYDFDGWFTAETEGDIVTESTTILTDTTYYAHWTPRDDTKYRVEHYLMNLDGEGYTLTDTDNLEGTSDTEVTPDINTYEGFTSPEKQTVNVNADGSRVVVYEYTRNKYEFTLGSDNGVNTEGSTETGSYYYGTGLTLKAVISDGYKWDRWSNGDTDTEISMTMPAGDLTIAPEAHPITYTITYKLNGGRVDYKKTTYNIETPTFYIENPKKKGYIFTGWTGTDIETSTTDLSVHVGSIGNRTFEATWGDDIYTMSFDGNGETSGSMETVTVKPGESIKLPENGFVRDGYSFVGWYTTEHDRFGTFYKNGATVSDLTESVTLHAQWKKNKDTVEPGENGNGSGNSGSGSGDGGSTDDHGNGGNGSGSGDDSGNGSGSGHGNDGHNEPMITTKDEVGYFGTAFIIRNEISIRTTLGMNDKKLTLNYNY